MTDAPPDRRHNREEDSPEALRRSIDSLAQTISALDRRLDEVVLRLDGELDGARVTTRLLATQVGHMGEALIRRMDAESVRSSPVKRRRKHLWPLALALTFGLILAIAGVLALWR
jgi:hypothetical protein